MNAQPAREDGGVIGLIAGEVVGWISAVEGESGVELLVEGQGVVAEAPLTELDGGRLEFRVSVPGHLKDGTIRFLSVRRKGADTPLPGGPLVFDGGLFPEPTESSPSTRATGGVEGEVTGADDGRIRGWAWAPTDAERRCAVQVWRGDELLGESVADLFDQALADAGVGDGAHAFEIDLTRRLAAAPQLVEVFVAGEDAPLRGGAVQIPGRGRDGAVDCPGYLDRPEALAKIESTPYEHAAYEAVTLSSARQAPRLINRLRRERTAYAAGSASGIGLLLQLGEGESDAGWDIQSYPHVSRLPAPKDPEALRGAVRDAARVYFARAGDALHPSTVGITLAIAADVVTWHRFEPSEWRAGAPGRLRIYPRYDRITARHGAAADTTLCLSGALLAQAPDTVLEALAAGRMHPLHFWLAGRDLAWAHHPEGLTTGAAVATPPTAADLAFFEEAILDEGLFTLAHVAGEGAPPFVLLPIRRARRISVLICFRDHAEATLACLHSIYGQHLTGELEVVLVDNQSSPGEVERVREGAVALFGAERIVLLAYDRPFNHSAQNNLAAREASGDVVVICNNDIVLSDPSALEQMAAWALVEGVGAVGCRLDDPRRGVGSHGHTVTAPTANPYKVSVAENADDTFGRFVHAVPGATLALAAIARDRFLQLGGLDEVDFPIGYNDVEFMFRASRIGLSHLYLGHVHALHERGSSRTGDNEALQALRLNSGYAQELGQYRRFLAVEAVPAQIKAGKSPTGAATAKEAARTREQELQRLAAIEQLDETRRSMDAVHQALFKVQALILDR